MTNIFITIAATNITLFLQCYLIAVFFIYIRVFHSPCSHWRNMARFQNMAPPEPKKKAKRGRNAFQDRAMGQRVADLHGNCLMWRFPQMGLLNKDGL